MRPARGYGVDDEYLLALGRAVYAFQDLEILVVNIYALVTGETDLLNFGRKTFGPKLVQLTKALQGDVSVGGILHDELEQWTHSLESVDTLRNDVFHAWPYESGQVRVRKDGQRVHFHKRKLEAAQHRFTVATERGVQLQNMCSPNSTEAQL